LTTHRVLIVDDHSLVRQGLRTVLTEEPDMEVVGEADSAASALQLLSELQPDVVLTDLTLPDRNGLELVKLLKAQAPAVAVLVITIHDNELFLVEALEAGAAGYLLKDSPHQLIPLAIRAMLTNGCTMERRLVHKLLRSLPALQRHDMQQGTLAERLSDRELAVLRWIARGASNKEIGLQLDLAESTVKKYVQSLKDKLSVKDRAEAAVAGLRLGLLE
jgi:DNA-binding NarL/FixJ family response regulator